MFERLEQVDWDSPVVLFVGALTSGKGLQSLIAAFPLLLKNVPDSTLVVVGGGAYREVLQAFVVALDRGDVEVLEQLIKRGFALDRGELEGPWEDVKRVWK